MPLWLTIVVATAGLAVHALGLGAAVVNAVKAWYRDELNGLSGRIDREIKEIRDRQVDFLQRFSTIDQSREETLRKSLQQEFQIAALQGGQGELKGMLEQLIRSMESNREVRHEHEKELSGQLARLETNLDVAGALHKGFDRLADVLMTRKESHE